MIITWLYHGAPIYLFNSSWHITVFVTRITRRVPLVKQELLILPEHLSSPPVFCGVRVTRSSVLCVCFVDRCLSFWPFSFVHCVICSTSIYILKYKSSLQFVNFYIQTRYIRVYNVRGYLVDFNCYAKSHVHWY